MIDRTLFPKAFLLAGLLVAAPAAAADLEVPGWGEIAESPGDPARQVALAGDPAWSAFQVRHPGWTARWDETRRMPERAAGVGLFLERDPADPSEARALVEQLLAREASSWLSGVVLDPVRSIRQGASYWVQYVQRHRGVRVVGAQVHARVGPGGVVPSFGIDVVPGLDLEVTPAITETRARLVAVEGFPKDVDAPALELVILPVPGQKNEYRLAYEARFPTWSPPGDWVAHVDARTGALLRRMNHARAEDISGTILADVETREANGPVDDLPLRHLGVSILDGSSAVAGEAVTNIDGAYVLGPVPPGPYTLQVPLAGPFGFVINHRHDSETTVLSIPVVAPGTGHALFTGTNSRVQDRDAFYWATIAHDYVRRIQSDFTFLDYPMPIVTDVRDANCNAFWNGYGILFFEAGSGCPATARSASVVVHEYGHGVTDLQYRPFSPSGAMHEGFSDYLAATLLDDPIIGRGFRGPGTSIRTVDNTRRWPESVTGEPHNDGLIVAGALWDMREALGRTLADSLWHYARYGVAGNFDDYFFDLLLADDDNGNVYDGTPHMPALVDAFRGHGIGDYSIRVTHLPLPDTEDTNKSFTLRASFLSLFAIVDSTVTAHVELHGAGDPVTLSVPMLPTGGNREYAAVLDPQAGGATIRYWFTARDIEGGEVTYPSEGAAQPFQFQVGPDVIPPVVLHDPLADQPIDMPAVRFLARVRDNLDRGLGPVRVDYAVNGSPGSGDLALVAQDRHEAALPTAGLAPGDVVTYRLTAADSAQVPNVTVVPASGEHTFHLVPGRGYDFEADDGGFSANGDWEWGESESVHPPYSGTRVWSTGLHGPYASSTAHDLVLGPFDFSDYAKAALVFHHAYDLEAGYDGCFVHASTDGGTTWMLLIPEGDYPYGTLAVNDLPGWSGQQEDWAPVGFELSRLRGASDVRFRFRLESDPSLAGAGWFVDDVQVLARQVFARPLSLEARSGRDGRVPLLWIPPLAVDTDGPDTPLLGYHVYRQEGEEEFERLTADPHPATTFIDSTAVNGVPYRYRVTAAYADGESAPTLDEEGMAFVAGYAADLDSIAVALPAGEIRTESVPFRNTGTGRLRVAVWVGGAQQDLDDVRVRYPVAEQPSYEVLFTDTNEPILPGLPDLSTLEASITGTDLSLRVSSFETWASFHSDFNLQITFDVDGNPSTGARGDYYLLAGYTSYFLYGRPATLFRDNGAPIGPPRYVDLPDTSDAATFTISLVDLGQPETLEISVSTLSTNQALLLDRLPNVPNIPWLRPGRRFVEVTPEELEIMAVDLVPQTMPSATYRARLLFETNDPARPQVVFPVAMTVGVTPVQLLDFRAATGDLGVVLTWRATEADDHAGFHVLRRDLGAENETRVTGELLRGTSGVYVFEDRAVLPGQSYAYRLADVSRDGSIVLHGPVTVRYLGAAALTRPVLRPSAPNPFTSAATVRYGLPDERPVSLAVFGIDGRRVRTLLDGVPTPAGFHEATWDGRDDTGRRVAAGVYTLRLIAGETRLAHKLVLAR